MASGVSTRKRQAISISGFGSDNLLFFICRYAFEEMILDGSSHNINRSPSESVDKAQSSTAQMNIIKQEGEAIQMRSYKRTSYTSIYQNYPMYCRKNTSRNIYLRHPQLSRFPIIQSNMNAVRYTIGWLRSKYQFLFQINHKQFFGKLMHIRRHA